MDAKQCEPMAEHERKEQHGGPPVKGNWRTSIYLGMEMIKHATTANKTEANGSKQKQNKTEANGNKQNGSKRKQTKRRQTEANKTSQAAAKI